MREPPWGSAPPGGPPYSLRRGLEDLEGLGVPGGQAVQGCHLCQGGRGVPGGREEKGEPQQDGGPGRGGGGVCGGDTHPVSFGAGVSLRTLLGRDEMGG